MALSFAILDCFCPPVILAFALFINNKESCRADSYLYRYDNSVMESFFASLKREELYRKKYRSEKEFYKAVEDYIEFYNEQRPHAKLQYKTPNQKEREYKEKSEDFE